jgi:membrane-associated phospholipid phosphatase
MDFEFKLYRRTLAFLIPYFAGAAFFLLLIYGAHANTVNLHLALRPKASVPILDFFFKYYTHIGTGGVAVAVVLVILLVLRKWRYAISLALSFASASVVTQVLKHLFDAQRPFQLFNAARESVPEEQKSYFSLWLVEGVDLKTSPSFPSGHATTAFVLFLSLAFISRNPWVQVPCLVFATLVAYSRIYLTQHFAADVLVGSLVGVVATCIVFPLVRWAYVEWRRRKDENYLEDEEE